MTPFFSTGRLWTLRWAILVAALIGVLAAAAFALMQGREPYGLATVQVYVDEQTSALGSASVEPDALAGRAPAYAELAKSSEIQEDVARRLGAPGRSFVVLSRVQASRADSESASDATNTVLPGTPSVLLTSQPDSPLISLEGQGPSAAVASRLVNATSLALRRFVLDLQNQQAVARGNQIRLRQLGSARATRVDGGVPPIRVLGVGVGVWLGLSLLIVLGEAVVRRTREERRARMVDGGDFPARPVAGA